MVISTASKKGRPWISPVVYAVDKNFNFYWTSAKNTHHSKLISSNKNIAIAIFNTTSPLKQGEGVYIEAEAYEVKDHDLLNAAKVFEGRFSKDTKVINIEKYNKASPGRLYRATPQKVWLLANENKYKEDNYLIDKKVEIILY